ncbi:MAG: DUF6102 family protein [Defluviitaleaceae bacterium]|nr:DUF6102 family protein [Defluviitaleaceae bacterium]
MDLGETAFFIERGFTHNRMAMPNWIGNWLGLDVAIDLSPIFNLFRDVGISLIIVKTAKKAFDTYIGWYDGDKDTSPLQLLTRFLYAMIMAISFPVLYQYFTEFFLNFISASLNAITQIQNQQTSFGQFVNILSHFVGPGIFVSPLEGIMMIVVFVCMFVLYIKFMILGIELLILRIGFPIATIGLVDSDGGVFKGYIKKMIIVSFTVLMQVTILRFSLYLLEVGHLFYGTSFIIVAMRAPKLLNEFIITGVGIGSNLNIINRSAINVFKSSKSIISLARARALK